MIQWLKDHKAVGIIAAILGVSTATTLAYFVGRRRGSAELTDLIIKLYENGDNNMIVTSTDPKLGNLMYEIKAECIGD